jgi:hypothetical protein
MKKIKGIIANNYNEILKAIQEGKPLSINDILVAWRNERNETSLRVTDKLHFLYGRIFELEDQLKDARER